MVLHVATTAIAYLAIASTAFVVALFATNLVWHAARRKKAVDSMVNADPLLQIPIPTMNALALAMAQVHVRPRRWELLVPPQAIVRRDFASTVFVVTRRARERVKLVQPLKRAADPMVFADSLLTIRIPTMNAWVANAAERERVNPSMVWHAQRVRNAFRAIALTACVAELLVRVHVKRVRRH